MPGTFEYDSYSNNPANFIQNETVTLQPIDNFNGQLCLVQNAPFFIDDFKVTYNSTVLTEKKDYDFILPYDNGMLSTGLIMYAGLVLFNLPNNAIVKVTYRTIGGTYLVDPNSISYFLLNLPEIFNIYDTPLDNILAYMNNLTDVDCLPPPDFTTLSSDTTTKDDLTGKINEIATTITNRAPIPYTEFHINDFNNPHVTTKKHLNLDLVPNLRLATDGEATILKPLNVLFTYKQLEMYFNNNLTT